MLKHAFQKASFAAFLKQETHDSIDIQVINLFLLASIIEKMLKSEDIAEAQATETLRAIRSLLNMAGGVKFYDFLADSVPEMWVFRVLRRAPKPKQMFMQTQYRLGVLIFKILAEYRSELGFKELLGLDADSKVLSAELYSLLHDLTVLGQTSAVVCIDGVELQLVTDAASHANRAATTAYETVQGRHGAKPAHQVDIKV